MTMHTLTCTSYFPHIGIAQIEGKRLDQIVAKLMAERFPAFSFSYAPSPILTAPNTNHFLDIGVKSFEVVKLSQAALAKEASLNPEGLEKWLMFIFDNGEGPNGGPQCSVYMEHDLAVIKRCMADPTLAETIALYSSQPTTLELAQRLDAWSSKQQRERKGSRFSCINDNVDIRQFLAFYIGPCREEASHPDADGPRKADVIQCGQAEAAFWTIYGSIVDQSGCEWFAIHDAYSAPEIVRIARQIHLETRKPFFYRDEEHGSIPTNGGKLSFAAIAEDLTHTIHDALPDLASDDFANVDDFDTHPLAEMREAFVMFSDYAGLDTAADPYQPWENRT